MSKEGWNPYLQTKECSVPVESRMFSGGENIPGDVGEVGVTVAASQSHAIWDFTREINLDSFPHNINEENRNECNTESRISDQGDSEVNKSSA